MKANQYVKRMSALLALAGLMAVSQSASAHNPLCLCRNVAGGQVSCKGGFSDGSGAPGVTLDVVGYNEKTLVKGKLGANSTLVFKRPAGEFYVVFDAGPGHVVEVDHTDIK